MRKIVGILSMQKVLNYGSFLQAFALKQMLLQNGADEVYFIDIEKGRALPGYEQHNSLFSKSWRALLYFLKGKLLLRLRDGAFYTRMRNSIRIQFPLLGLDKLGPSRFDVAVIGSDEVFNCCQITSWGYTLQLYGKIPQADKVISYAGSFGHTTYEQLLQTKVADEIGMTMKKHLGAISVRDQNSYDIIRRLTGVEAEIHLDPVLIYGYKKEIEQFSPDMADQYMVIYSYQGRIKDKREIKEITAFAKTNGLKLVSVFCRYDWCDMAVIPDTPFEVLGWFKKAKYVVTDTFHGTIFSIITQRPFCSLIRDTNMQKMGALLNQLGLSEQSIPYNGVRNIDLVLKRRIDYKSVEDILQLERNRAMCYIKSQLA